VHVRLLVVDDDPRYGRLVAHLLREIACVETCVDGTAAVERVAREPFDWVLLDVGLGATDGFAVLDALRARVPDVRVVLHTALDIPDGRRRALAAGAVDLIEKPLPLAYLRALLLG
jgi:CheY-like chemotaxis protein